MLISKTWEFPPPCCFVSASLFVCVHLGWAPFNPVFWSWDSSCPHHPATLACHPVPPPTYLISGDCPSPIEHHPFSPSLSNGPQAPLQPQVCRAASSLGALSVLGLYFWLCWFFAPFSDVKGRNGNALNKSQGLQNRKRNISEKQKVSEKRRVISMRDHKLSDWELTFLLFIYKICNCGN